MKPLIQSPASWQADSQAESAFRKGLFTRPRPVARVQSSVGEAKIFCLALLGRFGLTVFSAQDIEGAICRSFPCPFGGSRANSRAVDRDYCRGAAAPIARPGVDRLFSYRRSDGACRGVDQRSHASLGLFNIVQQMADVDSPGAVSGPCAEPQFEKAAEASQIGVDLKKTKESLLIGGRFDGPIEGRVS